MQITAIYKLNQLTTIHVIVYTINMVYVGLDVLCKLFYMKKVLNLLKKILIKDSIFF